MALPAGRYGVTKNQLLKIKKLPMNTIKLIEEIQEELDTFGTAVTHDSTSVVTDSSDLVESGAVKDIVGWGNKNLLQKSAGGISNGVTFIADSDGIITANGTASNYNAQLELPIFTAQHDGMVILNGCNSDNVNIHMYPWCVTDGARPYADATKTTRISYSDNVYNGNSVAFYMEKGKKYLATCRVMMGSTANNQLFYPMISKDGGEYEPYHESVSDSLAEKCDNSIIGTVEGANASKAWSVGEHFIKDGAFKEVTQPIASGGDINDSNTVDKPIAELFTKQAVTGIAVDGTVLKSIVSNNSYIIPAYKLAVLNLVVKVGTYAAWTICLTGLPKPMNSISAVIANRERSTAMLATIYTQGNIQLTNLTGSDPVEDNEIVMSIVYNYDSL